MDHGDNKASPGCCIAGNGRNLLTRQRLKIKKQDATNYNDKDKTNNREPVGLDRFILETKTKKK